MEYVTLAFNIMFFVFLGFGLLNGFCRGLKRTVVRSVWIILIVCLLVPLSINITSMILKLNIPFTYEGQKVYGINELLLTLFKDILQVQGNYQGLVDVCMFLVTLLLNGLIYLILYWVLKLLTIPFYWIVNGFIFAGERRKKKRAKREKEKIKIKKYRLAGALVGIVLGLISFCSTMTPIMGYINIAKIVEKETAVDGGNGVISQNIGDTYTDVMNAYNSSIPISLMNSTGVDNFLLSVFDGLTASKISNKRIVLKDEAVSFSKIYNEIKDVKLPDLETTTQAELDEALTKYEKIVDVVFESQLISATSDVVIPFGVAFARKSIDTNNFKPYVLAFYNALFDEMENLNSSSTHYEVNGIIGLVKTLNDSNLLLPIIQNSDSLNITYLQQNLTKEVSDKIIDNLFSINTVNNVAPALVNFLLGFGAEQLNYEYSSDNVVTSEALKHSVSVLMTSAIDLLQNYSEENSTKIALNETTIGAIGGMLDEVKQLLSAENFNSIVDALEPKFEDIALNALTDQPQFMQDTVKEAIGNIGEISSYKNTLLDVYGAVKEIEKQFEDAKVDDSYDVQYMDFIKIGGAIDDIQNGGLFKNDLLLKTMKGAVNHFADSFEESLAESGEDITLTFKNKVVENIDDLIGEGITWESELPKYKNTFGVFINLFQNDGDILDKLKSDADSTLEDLGYELDNDLKGSALFKDVDRLLVADILTIANSMINGADDGDLTTLIQDVKDNVLDSQVNVVWEDELFHIKQLIKIEFNDLSDNSLLELGSTIDKVVFDYNNGERVIPKSTIITQDIINNYIANYMDSVFEGVDEENDFYTIIQKIKDGFNTLTIASYRDEINALLKLKDVKTIAEDGFDFKTDAGELGRKIDESISLGSNIVDKDLVNDFITKKIDTYFAGYSDMQDEIAKIKLGFNDEIEKYEVEFTALVNLMSIFDTVSEAGFNFEDKAKASTLGKNVDTALATKIGNYTSKIVDRELINGHIKNYIADKDLLDANSQFGDVINNITGTKSGDEFGQGRIDTMTSSYENEFGYLSQLLTVSKLFANIEISNIAGEVVIDSPKTTTLADQFDGFVGNGNRVEVSEPLKNSYLVGDSLLVAIDSALQSYNDAEYNDILTEVKTNYSKIKPHVIWAGNSSGELYYTNVIDAIAEINTVLNSNIVKSIGSLDDLNENLAEEYENTLYELQGDGESSYGNILLQTNGVNKIAILAMTKVKELLEKQIIEGTPLFSAESNEIKYINAYIDFLNGKIFNEYEQENVAIKDCLLQPYAVTAPNYYAFVLDAAEKLYGIEESTNSYSGIQINSPFTYLVAEIKGE